MVGSEHCCGRDAEDANRTSGNKTIKDTARGNALQASRQTCVIECPISRAIDILSRSVRRSPVVSILDMRGLRRYGNLDAPRGWIWF